MDRLCYKADDIFTNGFPYHIAAAGYKNRNAGNFHEHSGFAECMLITRGEISHRILTVSGSQEYILSEGNLVFIPEKTVHSLSPSGNGEGELINIALSSGELKRILSFLNGINPLSNVFSLTAGNDIREMFYYLSEQKEQIRKNKHLNLWTSVFLQIINQLNWKDILKKRERSSLILPSFHENIPHWLKTSVIEFESALINNESSSAMGINSLVGSSGKSREHFSRSFKSYFGITPVHYIKKIKIKIAAADLLRDNEQIRVLADRYGFESSEYFTRVFTAETGLSPRAYRNKKLKEMPLPL